MALPVGIYTIPLNQGMTSINNYIPVSSNLCRINNNSNAHVAPNTVQGTLWRQPLNNPMVINQSVFNNALSNAPDISLSADDDIAAHVPMLIRQDME